MKKNITFIVYILLYVAVAVGCARATVSWGAQLTLDWGMSMFGGMLLYVAILLALVNAAKWISTLVHESGHMLGGWLSGHRFCYIRVGSLMLLRREGKLLLKRYSLPGTDGQCLMDPLPDRPADAPTRLMDLGGPLANGLMVLLLLPLHLCCGIPTDSLGGSIISLLLVMDLWILAVNLLPVSGSDGYHFFFPGERADRICRRNGVRIMALQTGGLSMSQTPEELFILPEGMSPDHRMAMAINIDKANMRMAQGRLDEARELLRDVLALPPQAGTTAVRAIAENDMLFLELIGENDPEQVKRLQSKAQVSLMRRMKYSTGMLRTRYALAVMQGNEAEKAWVEDRMDRLERIGPYPQDVRDERALMHLADEAARKE